MITITVFFKNDSSVGLQPETYTMETPDFREGWTETSGDLDVYIEEKRKQLKELYTEFHGETVAQVLFQWELEECELRLQPIEEPEEPQFIGDPVKDLISYINWIQPLTILKKKIIKEMKEKGFDLIDMHFIPLLDAAEDRWKREFGKSFDIDVVQERAVTQYYVNQANK